MKQVGCEIVGSGGDCGYSIDFVRRGLLLFSFRRVLLCKNLSLMLLDSLNLREVRNVDI